MRPLLSRLPRLIAAAAGLALGSLATPGLPGQALAEAVNIQGSTTFSARLIEPYRSAIESRAGRQLDVIANKSIHGLVALLQGRTHLAMISSSIDGELEILRQRFPKAVVERLQSFEIARTRIAFVAHPGNAVRRANLADIARILRGDIRSWAELGGADIAITVITTQPGGGVPTTVRSQLLGGNAMTPARVIQVEASSNIVKITAQMEGAFGIAQLGLLGVARVLELETDTRVEQELNLVTLGEPGPAAAAVIEAARHVAASNLF